MSNGNGFGVVVLGDSVQWGQGLPEAWKFSELVMEAIRQETHQAVRLVHRFARSGAWLSGPMGQLPAKGNFDPSPGDFQGEIPDSTPSIHSQFNALLTSLTNEQISRDSIDLVLIDGGINDIGIANIINPLTSEQDLRNAIARIYDIQESPMRLLLQQLTGADGFPNAIVVITGYYPVFSPLSSILLASAFLQGLGIPVPSDLLIGSALTLRLSHLSELWSEISALALHNITNQINSKFGARRVAYAHVPFGPENSLFAPNSWLFGLSPLLTPEDPIAPLRIPICRDENLGTEIFCLWASVGHPNRQGAWQYSRAIIRSLRELGVLDQLNIFGRVCAWAQDLEFQCLQWREDRRTECQQEADQGYSHCAQERDDGFNDCRQQEDQGYNDCNGWNPWFRWLCIFWVWISNVVCVLWVWMKNIVCVLSVWITNMVCVLWTEFVYRSCQAFTWSVKKLTCG